MSTPARGVRCGLLLALGLTGAGVWASESAAGVRDGVRLLTCAHAGDLELALAVPAEARRVVMFYGTNHWWLVRLAHRERDAYRASIYAWKAPELVVRTLWDDDAGIVHEGAGARFAISGGDAAWARASQEATGCPVGFNLIPASGDEFPENLRTVAELGAHGVHDLLINFYATHYQSMLGSGQLDELMGECDRAGAQVWINTRDTDPLSERYYPEAGMMSGAEAERYAFTYTLVRNHRIDGAEIAGDSGDFADQWWLPHWSAADVLAVTACVYDPASPDPLPGAIELPAAAVEWHYVADPRRAHRPTITYRIRGCDAWQGRAATVRIALRTLRVWTLPPLWDDDYYDGFYRPRMLGDLVRQGRLLAHRSFRGIAAINEPTISWQGGELWHPSIQARWTAFLQLRFPLSPTSTAPSPPPTAATTRCPTSSAWSTRARSTPRGRGGPASPGWGAPTSWPRTTSARGSSTWSTSAPSPPTAPPPPAPTPSSSSRSRGPRPTTGWSCRRPTRACIPRG